MSGYEELLRPLVPQVLGVLVRRHGDFDTCEDAVQEALTAAIAQWPVQGTPANPTGWLITVASRRRIEMLRSDIARRHREETAAALEPPSPQAMPAADDTLAMYLLFCVQELTVQTSMDSRTDTVSPTSRPSAFRTTALTGTM